MENLPTLFEKLLPKAHPKKGEKTKIFAKRKHAFVDKLWKPSSVAEIEFEVPDECDIEPSAKLFGENLIKSIIENNK